MSAVKRFGWQTTDDGWIMKKILIALLLFFISSTVDAEVFWYGDYESGFHHKVLNSGWHLSDGAPHYHGIPQYGRPPRMEGDINHPGYYGNGTLHALVTDVPALERVGEVITGPVRQGNYAAKFTVKNSINGT